MKDVVLIYEKGKKNFFGHTADYKDRIKNNQEIYQEFPILEKIENNIEDIIKKASENKNIKFQFAGSYLALIQIDKENENIRIMISNDIYDLIININHKLEITKYDNCMRNKKSNEFIFFD